MSSQRDHSAGPGEPPYPPLDAAEVAALPVGTPIIVLWSGGNGPHRYTVQRSGDVPVAATADEVARGRLDIEKALDTRIGFVGTERYHTRVWKDIEP
jgi:hypothetical protein